MFKRKWLLGISRFLGLFFLIMFLSDGTERALDHFNKTSWLWWGLFAMIALITLFQLAMTIGILITVGGAKSRRPTDVSAENRPPTPNVTRLIAELNTMGFTRLGETYTKVSLLGSGLTYLMVGPDKADVAEVIDIGGRMPTGVQFGTAFMDDASLETSYPFGENQDAKRFRARYNTESLAAAYQQHLTERAAMQAEHGTPRIFSNMPQYQEWDIRYRELHVRKRLGRPALPSILMSIWFLVLLAVFGFMGIATENPDQYPDDTVLPIIIGGVGFLVIGGLIILGLGAKDMKIGKDITTAKAKEEELSKSDPNSTLPLPRI